MNPPKDFRIGWSDAAKKMEQLGTATGKWLTEQVRKMVWGGYLAQYFPGTAVPGSESEMLRYGDSVRRWCEYQKRYPQARLDAAPCDVCGAKLVCQYEDKDEGRLYEQECKCLHCRMNSYHYSYGNSTLTYAFATIEALWEVNTTRKATLEREQHRKAVIAEAHAMWHDPDVNGFLFQIAEAQHHRDAETHRRALLDFLTEYRDGTFPIQTQALTEVVNAG